jgi:WD40 repeat protein
MSAKGDFIAAGGVDGVLRVFRVKYSNNKVNSLVPEKELAVHSAQINAVGFNSKGDVLFSASSDRTCRIFSTQDWKLLHCLTLETAATKFEFRDAL